MILRRVVGVALAVSFLAVAMISIVFGITMDGRDDLSTQCQRSSALPTAGGPYLEDTAVSGSPTFTPLGVACTYDSPNDSFGPQTIAHPDWPATVTGGTAFVLAIISAVVAIRVSSPLRGRPRPITPDHVKICFGLAGRDGRRRRSP